MAADLGKAIACELRQLALGHEPGLRLHSSKLLAECIKDRPLLPWRHFAQHPMQVPVRGLAPRGGFTEHVPFVVAGSSAERKKSALVVSNSYADFHRQARLSKHELLELVVPGISPRARDGSGDDKYRPLNFMAAQQGSRSLGIVRVTVVERDANRPRPNLSRFQLTNELCERDRAPVAAQDFQMLGKVRGAYAQQLRIASRR